MKFIDLFSGIGGFRSALEKHGHECLAYSEVDKYARQSYQAIYNTENEVDLGDVTQVSDEYWRQFKGKCDIIVGGTPCQSFSMAGKRRGFEDTRGTLFFNYINAIKQVKPKYFVFENVKGLVNHDNGNTIRTMLAAFDEIGYEIDFDIFNSKYYGVPQNRERIYIVGRRKSGVHDYSQEDVINKSKKIQELKNWASQNIALVNLLPINISCNITTKLSDILETDIDERYYLPNERLANLMLNDDLSGRLNHYNYRELDTVYSIEKVAPTINTMQGGGRQPKIVDPNINDKLRVRRLTPLECWRLQGFTDEQFYKAKNDGVSNSQLYKQSGNAVTVNVVDAIISELEDE